MINKDTIAPDSDDTDGVVFAMQVNVLPMIGLALASALAASAAEAAPAVQLSGAWIQTPMPGAKETAAYVHIDNPTEADDRLLSVSSRWAGRVDMHEMVSEDGMMGMRALTYGVKIPAGGSVDFSPQALHIMFVNLRKPFVGGKTQVPVQFRFLKAGTVTINVPVQNLAPTHHH